jgi:hypothetical protein
MRDEFAPLRPRAGAATTGTETKGYTEPKEMGVPPAAHEHTKMISMAWLFPVSWDIADPMNYLNLPHQ